MAAYSARIVCCNLNLVSRPYLIRSPSKTISPNFKIQCSNLHSVGISQTRSRILKLKPNDVNYCLWHRAAAARFLHSDPTDAVTTSHVSSSSPYIPEPPLPPAAPTVIDTPELGLSEVIQTLGEPSFESLGLAGWTPVGLLRSGMEFLHITLDLPWWGAIAIGTIIVRIAMFPLVIKAQQNAAKMNNNLPQMQVLQLKMSEARRNGDAMESAKYGYELMNFMKEKDMNPLKNFIVPACQAPVFISFFMCLRSMANLPIESMSDGGIWWFVNLTVPDPYYILPLITCTTVYITLELGIDGGVRTSSMNMMRYFFRAMPILIFPFTISFPAAILCYWTTSNVVSLCQVLLLRYPPVREYFKIEKLTKHPDGALPSSQKGMVETFRETIQNSKIAREIDDRARVDDIRFRKAGMGPLQKTYSFDPTKQNPTSGSSTTKPAVEAKPRDSR